MNNQKSKISCMFCNRTEKQVNKLFTGKKANICDKCIEVAFTYKNKKKNSKILKHHLLRKDYEKK